MNRNELHQEDQLPDLLRNLRQKGDAFAVPPTDFYAALADKIASEEVEVSDFKVAKPMKSSKPEGRIRFLAPKLLAIAATLLLLVWLKPWASTEGKPDSLAANTSWEASLNDVSDEDILAYIEDNISDFEIETLTNE